MFRCRNLTLATAARPAVAGAAVYSCIPRGGLSAAGATVAVSAALSVVVAVASVVAVAAGAAITWFDDNIAFSRRRGNWLSCFIS